MHAGLFAPLLPALARRFRVHAVDLPGHGRSPAVAPSTLDTFADAVARTFVDEREPLTVLGWSLGGLCAMRWALREPGRIARLVLCSTTPRFTAGDGWTRAMSAPTLARFGDEFGASWALTMQRFLALQVRGSDEGRATLAALRDQLYARGEPSRAALADALRILATADLRTEVGGIEAPALVVTGDRDAIVPPAAGAWLAGALPNARLAIIEGAAHLPFLSHSAAFERAIGAFVHGD
jgi:pimeloyl-[acyl-carrier protein] methyl ester esterase